MPLVEKFEHKQLVKESKTCCYKETRRKYNCSHKQCKYLRKRNSLMLNFLFDTGARVADLVNIKIADLNSNECGGTFRSSYTKGKKDRIFKLNKKFHKELRKFIKTEK